ncbi:MAG: type II toxin-antitoxin system VapC family toxin [Acidobacteria bacterium]|nr:type II toxin-antitoxin system VapC family toxin [Acidobacteriota bacterium]
MPSVVADASAVIDFLSGMPDGAAVGARFAGAELHAPHVIDLEVAHVLRRGVRLGTITEMQAGEILQSLREMKIRRYPHGGLLPRIWQLRHNLTAYDAAYVALAELLGAPLVTRDGRLARSAGHGAAIELIA